MRTFIATLCALTIAALAGAQTSPPASPGFNVAFLDRTADACTDFYQFACGNWIATHPLPADKSRLNRMAELADRNEMIVRGILERAAATASGRTPNEQKIGDYYASCMDEAAVERKGAAPIRPLLDEINRVSDIAALGRLAARFNHDGLPAFIRLGPEPDLGNASMFIATIGEGARGLPDRDLYLNTDQRSMLLRTEYLAHLKAMFALLGESAQAADASAQQVMTVETTIARASYDRLTMRDPTRRYNPMSMAALQQLAPAIDFAAYFAAAGAPAVTRVNVINPQYVRDLDAALRSLPIEAWRSYMKWRVLGTLAPLLSSPFANERFRFTGRILSGQQEMRPRWNRCVATVAGSGGDDQLGEIVGEIFVKEHFGGAAPARITELVSALERSLERNLRDLDWMSPATKQRALEKLKALNRKVGAPQRWRSFADVRISRDDLVANARSVRTDDSQRQMKWIGQPVDKDLWLMTPQTVNAYFSPPQNEVVFPAGILQPPFFDATKDDAVNFGAIGGAIGHELSHGFDDQGRKYDARGNLADWWTPEDDKTFRTRAACVAEQYGGYTAVDNVKLNGQLTLGENVADNAGLHIAFYALMEVLAGKPPQPPIDGFTQEQRFFIAWGQMWCETASNQDQQRRAREDPHSNGRWRTNGVLQNSMEFRKAFGCATGQTAMAPEKVCRVW